MGASRAAARRGRGRRRRPGRDDRRAPALLRARQIVDAARGTPLILSWFVTNFAMAVRGHVVLDAPAPDERYVPSRRCARTGLRRIDAAEAPIARARAIAARPRPSSMRRGARRAARFALAGPRPYARSQLGVDVTAVKRGRRASVLPLPSTSSVHPPTSEDLIHLLGHLTRRRGRPYRCSMAASRRPSASATRGACRDENAIRRVAAARVALGAVERVQPGRLDVAAWEQGDGVSITVAPLRYRELHQAGVQGLEDAPATASTRSCSARPRRWALTRPARATRCGRSRLCECSASSPTARRTTGRRGAAALPGLRARARR